MAENKDIYFTKTVSEKPRNKAIEKRTNFVQDRGAKNLERNIVTYIVF